MPSTSLSSILRTKYTRSDASSNQVIPVEENLEKGRLWVFSEGNMMGGKFTPCICWVAPGTGTAVIEIWGAGGSSALACCCGWGLPGNAGAYSKKTVAVTSATAVRACIGLSCGNANTVCYRGRSEPTMVCICCVGGAATHQCMCAEGGFGGLSRCATAGASSYCCAFAEGYCTTNIGSAGCGIVCNLSTASIGAIGSAVSRAQAYGGDTNCQGMFSCVLYAQCAHYMSCQAIVTIAVPAGYITENGANIAYNTEDDNGSSTHNGGGLSQFLTGLNAAGKQPHHGGFKSHCMGAARRGCGCYENNGCGNWLPIGTGGLGVFTCNDVRDHGSRGGMGALRIRFYN